MISGGSIYIDLDLLKFWTRANFLHFHAVFDEIWPNNRLAPLFWVSASLWEIPDPPPMVIVSRKKKIAGNRWSSWWQFLYTKHSPMPCYSLYDAMTSFDWRGLLQRRWLLHYRPQTKFAKVMFLHRTVCSQVCVLGRGGGLHPVEGGSACRGDLHGGGKWPDPHHRILRDMVNEWVVRILLERILAILCD